MVAQPERDAEDAVEVGQFSRRRDPAADEAGCVERRTEPAEAEARAEAHGHENHAEPQRHRHARDEQVLEPAVPPPRDHHREERQREHRGQLHRDAERDDRDPERDEQQLTLGQGRWRIALDADRQPPDADLQPGQHQPDGQCVVVRAGDEMEDQQRVRRAQPQRRHRLDAEAARQPRQRPDDQHDADEREPALQQHAERDVVARDRGQPAAEPQHDRPVRRGCFAPHIGHAEGERVADAERLLRAERVRVHAAVHDLALREIAVDVAGKQRRDDQQRRQPQRDDPGQLPAGGEPGAVGQGELAEHQPGDDQDAHAGDGDREGHRRDAGEQPQHRDVLYRVDHRRGSGAERTQRQEQRADRAESADDVEAALLGRVEGLRLARANGGQGYDRTTFGSHSCLVLLSHCHVPKRIGPGWGESDHCTLPRLCRPRGNKTHLCCEKDR